jgi:hypothetical protein
MSIEPNQRMSVNDEMEGYTRKMSWPVLKYYCNIYATEVTNYSQLHTRRILRLIKMTYTVVYVLIW